MALHPAAIPFKKDVSEQSLSGLEAYRLRRAQASKDDEGIPVVTAQPIAGHDGTRFRVPKVTGDNLLATDGSGVTQPVSESYLRSIAEKAQLEDYALEMLVLDSSRGFEVR